MVRSWSFIGVSSRPPAKGRVQARRRLGLGLGGLSLLCAVGCSGEDRTAVDRGTSGAGGSGMGGSSGEGAAGGTGASGGSGGSTGEPSACVSVDDAFAWPQAESATVPAHESWKATLSVTEDPFLSMPEGGDSGSVRWVKFIVLTGSPGDVYFQDTAAYPFHYDFARDRIPAFEGMSRIEFDAATLHDAGRKAVLGAVLVPLDAFTYPEYGVQLVSEDDLHPELVEAIMSSVQAHVTAPAGTRSYYFPSGTSATCVGSKLDDFAARGIQVSSIDRWLVGDACYSPGWAVGRLVQLPAAEIEPAYLDGRLTPDDVLLISDTPPAELPFVSGVLTLAPSTPNAHTAILARSYSVPFAYLREQASRIRAEALVGRRVVVSTTTAPARDLDPSFLSGNCQPELIDVDALTPAELAELRALSVPPPVEVTAKRASGAISLPAEGLVPADIDRVGGKAANFGLLRAAAPDDSPTPAFALTFDAWDAFVDAPTPVGTGTLREEIARRLAPHAWPPDLFLLDTDLEGIRDLIEDAPFPTALAESVISALDGFDPNQRIRFRSSTNVEDSETFTGAGLYDSATGCLADDLDADAFGPSLCNPAELEERGVYRAIARVYASFYFRNAYFERLRRGVNEAEVGMGVLVHYSVPDPEELANGVATLDVFDVGYRHAELVSQPGATSVTNPEGGALPEQVNIDRSIDPKLGTSDFLTPVSSSSLLPLGAHAFEWERDYRSLMDLFNRVADRYARVTSKTPPFALDFEYKKVAPGELSLRQVRPLPLADDARNVTPFLLGGSETLCLYGSERADVFASHRLKARVAVEAGNLWLTSERLAQPVFGEARFEYVSGSASAVLEGNPSTFPGAAHSLEANGDEVVVQDAWTTTGASWQLRGRVPPNVTRSEGPVRTLRNLFFELTTTWSTPQQYLGYDFENGGFSPQTRTEEGVDLWGVCPDTLTPDSTFLPQDHTFAGPGGLSIRTQYWFPPPPRGITAGYTAPAAKWDQTTIAGITTEPIVLTGYYSQTYAPYHHNFGGQYIFDPRLEPGLSESLRSELETADIAFLIVIDNDGTDDELWASGLDGELRRL